MTQVFALPYEWIFEHVSRDRISTILSENELTKANRFVHIADRDRFIAARLFVFGLLKQKGLIDSDTLKLSYNSHGKPFISGLDIQFNWSHSGDMIAVIAGSIQCGIDIELQTNKEIFDYRSLCTPLELIWLNQKSQNTGKAEHEQFLDLWTAKESVVKAKGTGLSTDPRYIEIIYNHIHDNNWKCEHETGYYGRTQELNWLKQKYNLSWCTPINNLIYPILTKDIVKEIVIYI